MVSSNSLPVTYPTQRTATKCWISAALTTSNEFILCIVTAQTIFDYIDTCIRGSCGFLCDIQSFLSKWLENGIFFFSFLHNYLIFSIELNSYLAVIYKSRANLCRWVLVKQKEDPTAVVCHSLRSEFCKNKSFYEEVEMGVFFWNISLKGKKKNYIYVK